MSSSFEETRQQILAQGADLSGAQPAGGQPQSLIGANAVAAGATDNTVDVAKLMQMVQALQAQVDTLQSSAAAAGPGKPELARVADLIVDHLRHRANALGTGSVLDDAVTIAEDLASAAAAAVEGGPLDAITTMASKLARYLERNRGKTASADTSYVEDLARYDLPDAVDDEQAKRSSRPAQSPQVVSPAPPVQGIQTSGSFAAQAPAFRAPPGA